MKLSSSIQLQKSRLELSKRLLKHRWHVCTTQKKLIATGLGMATVVATLFLLSRVSKSPRLKFPRRIVSAILLGRKARNFSRELQNRKIEEEVTDNPKG
jgi:hypothetical protein